MLKIWQTGQEETSLLIMAIWDFFNWSLWDDQNKMLHHSYINDMLLDMDAVDMSIIPFCWIESHQDRKGKPLDSWPGLNIICDNTAKAF
jgi:hypothetical protein